MYETMNEVMGNEREVARILLSDTTQVAVHVHETTSPMTSVDSSGVRIDLRGPRPQRQSDAVRHSSVISSILMANTVSNSVIAVVLHGHRAASSTSGLSTRTYVSFGAARSCITTKPLVYVDVPHTMSYSLPAAASLTFCFAIAISSPVGTVVIPGNVRCACCAT